VQKQSELSMDTVVFSMQGHATTYTHRSLPMHNIRPQLVDF